VELILRSSAIAGRAGAVIVDARGDMLARNDTMKTTEVFLDEGQF
jgi:hypothetical protein